MLKSLVLCFLLVALSLPGPSEAGMRPCSLNDPTSCSQGWVCGTIDFAGSKVNVCQRALDLVLANPVRNARGQ